MAFLSTVLILPHGQEPGGDGGLCLEELVVASRRLQLRPRVLLQLEAQLLLLCPDLMDVEAVFEDRRQLHGEEGVIDGGVPDDVELEFRPTTSVLPQSNLENCSVRVSLT